MRGHLPAFGPGLRQVAVVRAEVLAGLPGRAHDGHGAQVGLFLASTMSPSVGGVIGDHPW